MIINEKNVILVILYGKKLNESTTLNSLLQRKLGNTFLLVVNNGPEFIHDSSYLDGFNVYGYRLDNCIQNVPLSILYNNFLREFYPKQFASFCIMDDDTCLGDDFFDALESSDTLSLSCPIIKSSGDRCFYPRIDGEIIGSNVNAFILANKIFYTIGSGMIFSRKLIDLFFENKIDLFDEHYSFYGVDSSFCKRLMKLSKSGSQIIISINYQVSHDLSGASGKYSGKRLVEQIWDRGLTLRHYPTVTDFKLFLKMSLKLLFSLNLKGFFTLYSAFFKGVHPNVVSYNETRVEGK